MREITTGVPPWSIVFTDLDLWHNRPHLPRVGHIFSCDRPLGPSARTVPWDRPRLAGNALFTKGFRFTGPLQAGLVSSSSGLARSPGAARVSRALTCYPRASVSPATSSRSSVFVKRARAIPLDRPRLAGIDLLPKSFRFAGDFKPV